MDEHQGVQDRIEALAKEITSLADRADAAEARADAMEARSRADREMIAELQTDGVLGREHAEQMHEALLSSRLIGAALGILMASRRIDQDQAFAVLSEASQRSNRKLRELAADLVASVTQDGLAI